MLAELASTAGFVIARWAESCARRAAATTLDGPRGRAAVGPDILGRMDMRTTNHFQM